MEAPYDVDEEQLQKAALHVEPNTTSIPAELNGMGSSLSRQHGNM
jgi:hypothetical protein